MMKNLIYENPQLAPLPNRIGWSFFTAFFWMVWVYLWLPLATIVLWWLGIISYAEYIGRTAFFEADQLQHTALVYGAVIVVLGGSLLLWARIEFIRFRNRSRRGIPVPVNADELAMYAGLSAKEVARWKSARCILAHHDSHGNIQRAEIIA